MTTSKVSGSSLTLTPDCRAKSAWTIAAIFTTAAVSGILVACYFQDNQNQKIAAKAEARAEAERTAYWPELPATTPVRQYTVTEIGRVNADGSTTAGRSYRLTHLHQSLTVGDLARCFFYPGQRRGVTLGGSSNGRLPAAQFAVQCPSPSR